MNVEADFTRQNPDGSLDMVTKFTGCGWVTVPPPPPVCDNDGVCEAGEDEVNCPVDCTASPPPPPQCSDGTDNDGDGLVDFPADCGCTGANDNNEGPVGGCASPDITKPNISISPIPDPTAVRLTSNGQIPSNSGKIAGTATDNVGVADIKIVIREKNDLTNSAFVPNVDRDWNGSAWVTAAPATITLAPGTHFTPGASAPWTYTGPPFANLVVGKRYRIYVTAYDAALNRAPGTCPTAPSWNCIDTNFIDNPSGGFITPIGVFDGTSMKLSTVITSLGQPQGTVSGGALDDDGVQRIFLAIRRVADCMDWNPTSGAGGNWLSCLQTITPILTSGTFGDTNVSWSTTQTPPLFRMDHGQSYTAYLYVEDIYGRNNGWNISQTFTYEIPPPTGLTGSCSADGLSATVSWENSAVADSYNLRVNNLADGWSGTCPASTGPGDFCSNEVNTLSKTFPTTPGASYSWWLHTCNDSGCSAQTPGNAFVCPSSVQCTLGVDKPKIVLPLTPGQQVRLTWTCSVNADHGMLTWNPGAGNINLPAGRNFPNSFKDVSAPVVSTDYLLTAYDNPVPPALPNMGSASARVQVYQFVGGNLVEVNPLVP